MVTRALRIGLLASLAAGCTAGRAGRVGPEGGVQTFDAGRTERDGSAGRDGAAAGDGGAGTDGGPSVFPDGAVPPMFELICDDDYDQDDDGRTDCEDEDCDGLPCDAAGSLCGEGTCGGCRGEPTETACGDGADEDCDGLRDCADPDCDGVVCGPGDVVCSDRACPCESGFEERICGDGTDDDCDSLIDCEDPDCMGRECAPGGLVCRMSGACECPGAVELCQGVDDDCSGTADEGCPTGLSTCCQSSAGAHGGTSGTAWADPCPTGAALVGIAGRADARLTQIQPICAAMIFDFDETRPEHTFFVRRGAFIYRTPHGESGAASFEDVCPGDQVVVGVRGHAGARVDEVSLRCASLTIERSAGFDWGLRVSPVGTTTSRGSPGTESSAFVADCGPSSVVTSLEGRASTRVDRLAVTCRRLQLDLR